MKNNVTAKIPSRKVTAVITEDTDEHNPFPFALFFLTTATEQVFSQFERLIDAFQVAKQAGAVITLKTDC